MKILVDFPSEYRYARESLPEYTSNGLATDFQPEYDPYGLKHAFQCKIHLFFFY